MRLFLEDEGALDLKLPYEELATKVADAVLDYEKCPYEAQVELLLTMNEEIRQMNLEFRGIDRATDVLSFPMTEFPSPADYAYLDTDDSSFDAHSVLHLTGYDHMEDEERLVMEKKQREVLEILGITR